MGNLISLMREIVDESRGSGNSGTAHIYRGSPNAIPVFHGSDKLPLRKANREFLKSLELYLRGRNYS